jgi:RNA polymerase sigma-70 factor (ECF subfamily)
MQDHLDLIEGRGAVFATAPLTDVGWLGPYPDAGLADGPAAPGVRYEQT